MAKKRLYAVLPAAVLLMTFQLPSLCPGQPITIHTSRSLDTLGSGGPYGPDTLGVTLRYFAEGTYDTVWAVDTSYDTTRVPIDVTLAFDLSGSMNETDGTSRWRITWTQISALRFLDSLKQGDRIAIFGWTANGDGCVLADTSNPARYLGRWLYLTEDLNSARSYIRDSLFLDGATRLTDTAGGMTLVKQTPIPDGTFDDTPLHISIFKGLQYMSEVTSPANKAFIMLTDGENDDNVAPSLVTTLIDSIYREDSVYLFTIGFNGGDTARLRSFAETGGGSFFNAANPEQLDSIYALLAGELVEQRIDTVFTTTPIRISPDTVRQPIDVLLAIDLSSSMANYDSTPRERISWAKIAALGFIDSLEAQDRVAVLGWTSISWGLPATIADTADPAVFYQKWRPFTSALDSVHSFLRDSIFLDSMEYGSANGPRCDTFADHPFTVWNQIPGGWFNYTPLHCTSILTMSRLSTYGRPGATKVVVLLTDGIDNDGVLHSYAIDHVDSLRRTQGLLMHTIGFVNGDTAELHELAAAGGGNFYNAKNNVELQSAYASLAHQLVTEKVAARKLTIQEVLNCPPLYYMSGTQSVTENSTVPLEKTESLTDSRGNPVLRWYFKTIPIWGIAEVYYKVVAAQGANTVIGIDSAGAEGGFWSQMVYTDDAYEVITINLPETGTEQPVRITGTNEIARRPNIAFRPGGVVRVHMAGQRAVAMTLYSLAGRVVYRDEARFPSAGATAQFSVAGKVPAGVYAACFTFEDRTVRYLMNILK
ncbi:MAG: VWA domain-containing protein [Chitinispirillaceae bacterium]|nr:VWA domain-containing protein [Chitinispirillaceae bacterium]